jgi:hypothetical protein
MNSQEARIIAVAYKKISDSFMSISRELEKIEKLTAVSQFQSKKTKVTNTKAKKTTKTTAKTSKFENELIQEIKKSNELVKKALE